jgi:hypothetical protein
MGTWGTGIKDNDTALDVYADYHSLLGTMELAGVMEKLMKFHRGKIESHEERNNFWLAIALAQWETNTLQSDVLQKVKTIIDTGVDIRLWEELKASKADIESRKRELANFLILIEKQNSKEV